MSDEPRPPKRPLPASIPPEVPAQLESSWDDDTSPTLELDDPMSESAFDRVTAIPDLPPEMFAKQVMAEQAQSTRGDQVPRLASEPPLVDVRPLDPMSLEHAPRAARALSLADMPAQPARVSSQSPTARPGRPRDTLPAEPTGLELLDLTGPATQGRPHATPFAHDPRDPVLELDLSEVASSAPPPPLLMPSAPATGRDSAISQMKDRYATGDFTGALVVAEALLESNPDDIDAQRYAQSCRDVLTQMYAARLGAPGRSVRVAVPGDQIRWLSLDHRAGFMLSLVDGSSTVEELLDISGMNRLDALRILYTLYEQRVIALG